MLNVARRLVASMTREDLEFQDADGDTYLHVSVCKADHNMVQALLERLDREQLRNMVNSQNCMRQTPLYLAVSSNSPEMVALLIEYDADVSLLAQHTMADGRTTETMSALHCIASKGAAYLGTLQALLTSRYIIINSVNSDGHTALHCAILEHGKSTGDGTVVDNIPIIQTLVRSGADPNAQGKKNGKTPLMYAVESRDFAVIESLVALIDPQHLDHCLRTRAYDETTCQKIVENLQRSMDEASRQRLLNCFKLRGRRDC